MRNNLIKKLDALEHKSGMIEPVIFVFNKDYSPKCRYRHETINGKLTFYDNGIEVAEKELNSRTNSIHIFNIRYVKPNTYNQ